MANTYVDYTGDGSETDFAINFDYIKTSHVAVEVNEGPAGGTNTWVRKTLGSDYTVVTSPTKQVVFTSAPANLVRVRVLRDSDANVGIVDFANGSVLTETELDNAYNHNRYLAQEAEEGASGGGFTKNPDGQYDADGLRIENLAAPDSDDDAVNKGYADTRFVNVTGDTLTGALTLSGDPTSDLHAATKQYVDDEVTTAVATEASARISGDNDQVSKTGDTMSGNLAMGGNKVTGLGSPGTGTDAANKTYVDDTVASVTAGTIPDGTITTAKLADDAVTAAKLDNTTVTPGSYTNTDITVDENGRITAASNGSSGAGATNLSNTPAASSVDIESSTGTNTTVAGATTSLAGVMTGADKTKLDGIATGATANAGTVTQVSTGTGLTGGTITGTGTISIDTGGVDTTQLADNAVTSTKISSSDTTFNINDSNGHIGIGELADSSFHLNVNGGTDGNIVNIEATRAGAGVASFIRNLSSTGISSILQLIARSGTTDKTASVNLDLQCNPGVNEFFQIAFVQGDNCGFRFSNSTGSNSGAFYPLYDGTQDLGLSSNRWDTVYATTGTINTSDRNEKEEIEELSEAEKRVAQTCKGLVRKFKFKGRVRKHIGVIAQDIRDAFSAEGLDATQYGLFCSDTFEDENGVTVTRLGVRYDELLAFIIAAL